jgi:hypothetical protein
VLVDHAGRFDPDPLRKLGRRILTSGDNGVLLCGHHHRAVHHDGWQVRLGTDRRPEFIPPAHVDPQCRPQRNNYHRRP